MEIEDGDTDRIHLAKERGPVGGSCEHGNEPYYSRKVKEYFSYVRDC
jgi:hypothetical protein